MEKRYTIKELRKEVDRFYDQLELQLGDVDNEKEGFPKSDCDWFVDYLEEKSVKTNKQG